MSAYKDEITSAMDTLATDPTFRFVGYGLLHGRAGGTLKNVPDKQIVETPTAENLMTGIAVGLSITGLRTLLYFERSDFLLNAADAIVNHLALMGTLSEGEFKPACVIRVTIGNKLKPLFTGPVHTQNFSAAFRSMLPERFEVWKLRSAGTTDQIYARAYERLCMGQSTMIFEEKDLW